MPERSLVIKVTAGKDDPERCNQAFTVAAAAVASGVSVSLWLTGESARFGLPARAGGLSLPPAAPPAEQHVGQAGVTDEGGTVQVGADHPAAVRAFRPVPVADTGDHGGQRLRPRPAPGHALVVLEAGEPAGAERGIDVRDDLTNAPLLAPPAADVEEPEPGHRLAFHTAELGPDDLVAGADREYHRAAGRGRGQPSARRQPARGQDLRQVLTAPEQGDVPVRGYPLVGIDLRHLDSEAPP